MLCRKLLWTRHPEEIHPLSEQPRHEITRRVEHIREKAIEMVLFDRIVNQDVPNRTQAMENTDASRQSAG